MQVHVHKQRVDVVDTTLCARVPKKQRSKQLASGGTGWKPPAQSNFDALVDERYVALLLKEKGKKRGNKKGIKK